MAESEVEDWTEWLDKDNEKREEILSNISAKDADIKKQILQNDLNEIADFLDVDDVKPKVDLEKKKTTTVSQRNEKVVTLESTPLNTLKDCEKLAETLGERIKLSKVKSVSLERFFSILITACESKLEDKDLNTIQKKIEKIVTNRERERRHKAINKRKPNSDMNVIKNYKDEVDMLYGDLSSYDEDDYDEFDEYSLKKWKTTL